MCYLFFVALLLLLGWVFPINNEQKTIKMSRCVIFLALLEIRGPAVTWAGRSDGEEWKRPENIGGHGSRIHGIPPY